MTRFALSLSAVALLAGAAIAQPPEALETRQVPVFADVDGDGILNHDDADFVRPGMGVGHGPREFIDADGDGINDLAPDTDGDGIANHLDDDYVRPSSGGMGHGARGFVDEDGDGINDLGPDTDGDGIMNHGGLTSGARAAMGHGRRSVSGGPGTYMDSDGDGVNDLAADHDGDGVANHLDADYERPSISRAGGRGMRGRR
ncbi:MAG: hypothetical protein O2782_04140 [bacterium]|nr:hypothetical protein [bacterium]